MYRKKKTGIIGIIITIIILIFLVVITNTDIAKMSYVENIVSTLVMPIQNGLTYLKGKLTGNDSFFQDINNLKEENENLKKKNSELEQSLREYEIVKSENDTLKEYMNLKDKYKDYTTMPAYVINKDISNYSNTVVINVGEKDGIKENMTVIADEGLVGHVISHSKSTNNNRYSNSCYKYHKYNKGYDNCSGYTWKQWRIKGNIYSYRCNSTSRR